MFIELALLAYLIDWFFGEFPVKHPVCFMGDYIHAFEQRYYRDSLLSGTILVVSLLSLTLLGTGILVYGCSLLPSWLSLLFLAILASTGLAMNMLHNAVAEVLTAANPKAVIRLLVSRDTEVMTETDILKAALETWAENLSDAVIAPLFYLVLFGLPGIAMYKAINTLDSMIAYKTDRYLNFGKTAAYLDDIFNFIPSRLTALFIVLLSANKRNAWYSLLRDGNKLESPNAGYPIAALAGSLDITLGGTTFYHGQLKQKPLLGLTFKPITQATVMQALQLKPKFDSLLLGFLTIGAILWGNKFG